MSRKLIKRHEWQGSEVKVYRDSEWQEYQVEAWKAGRKLDSYHTDDKEDALETALTIYNELVAAA